MRGTARAFKHLAPFAAGKTGTTDDELDAWFVGFTNDVTVAIWVGYDNAEGPRRTLGRGQTGGKVALPMFEPILEAAWRLHAPKTALCDAVAGGDAPACRRAGRSAIPANSLRPRPAAGRWNFSSVARMAASPTRIPDRSAESFAYRGSGYDEDGSRAAPYDSRHSMRDRFGSPLGYYRRPPPRISRHGAAIPKTTIAIARPRRVDPDYLVRSAALLSGRMRRFHAVVLIAIVAALFGATAGAQEFELEDVPSVTALPVGELKPRTVDLRRAARGQADRCGHRTDRLR